MLFKDTLRSRVERDSGFASALSAARAYTPKTGTDYTWVAEHAIREYERLELMFSSLDEKADGLIKYLAAGSGLLSLVFIQTLRSGNWVSALQVCPTLLLLVAAIVFAARARTPVKTPLIPLTKDALAYADSYPREVAMANFAAMTGVSSVALTLVIAEKAKLVRSSFRMLVFSIAWLALAVTLPLLTYGFNWLEIPVSPRNLSFLLWVR